MEPIGTRRRRIQEGGDTKWMPFSCLLVSILPLEWLMRCGRLGWFCEAICLDSAVHVYLISRRIPHLRERCLPRSWIKLSLKLRKFSILLDTRALEEQYQWRGFAFAVWGETPASQSISSSFKGQAPNRAPRGKNLLGSFLFTRAGPYLLFDVQVCPPKTPAVSGQTIVAPANNTRW